MTAPVEGGGAPAATAVVAGTGLMAPGIAAAFARAGLVTSIAGRAEERALEAARRAEALGGVPVGHGALGPQILDGCDVVVETVVEDVEVKRDLLRRIEGWTGPHALLVTNTSSLPIGELAGALDRPDRFAGLHFLNPAHLTAVVEVVAGPATSEEAVAALVELAARIGKRPLVVRRDVPGFVWNRLQFALLRECLHLVEEGVADVASVDAAVSDGLAPRWLAAGPLATADLGGLATFAVVARGLFPELASAAGVSPELAGRAAAGAGFYRWSAESRAAVEELRSRTIAYQRELARDRAPVMPPASDREDAGP